MKVIFIQSSVAASTQLSKIRLSLLSLIVMTGLAANTSNAALASQVFPVKYHAGQYCPSDMKAFVPKGTAHKNFVADISCMRQQLQAYQAESLPTHMRFQAYKANAWLSYVGHEDSEASLTKAGHYALNEALSILEALKTNQVDKLPLTADIPPTSGLQRPDLWASLLTIKQTPAFATLVKAVADSEVKLIWAEAEFCEFGWRHSREHYSAADRWVSAAELTALNTAGVDKQAFSDIKSQYLALTKSLAATENSKDSCRGAALPYVELPKIVVPEPIPQPVVPPVVVPVAPPVELQPAIIHFALDKSNVTASSRQVIDEFLQKFASYPNAKDFTFGLYGHTDSRASVTYNIALSKRRTGAVAKYLIEKGIDPNRITEYPQGENNLKTTNTDVKSHSLNRRVEIYILKDGVPITDAQANQAVMDQSNYSDLKIENTSNR